jgi:asparagine synthase (glutamine-hydrolysing)
MCGIVGGTRIEPGALDRAVAALRHRGPDAQAQWRDRADGGVVLGHTRLAVIDLNPSANQPMHCVRTGNVVVFNGEIYNFEPLRRELQALGWPFHTRSDTEVLLAAYGEWGAGCAARLAGMFAFVVYDRARQALFLARDRVGKKPLFYSLHAGLVFASELKGIFAARPELPRTIDPQALGAYLELGYVPRDRSLVAAVRKLPPAHHATYDLASHDLSIERYWQLPPPAAPAPDDQKALDTLDELLQDAVRVRLVSDVPLGLFLSGGLDSSLVAALAQRLRRDLVSYTVQFPQADETEYARLVARALGLEHRVVPVGSADLSTLVELGAQLDEPLGDSSVLPTYLLSRAVRSEITVALAGDGGDELFAGYDAYLQPYLERGWRHWPVALRRLVSGAQTLVPVGTPGRNFLKRLSYDGAELFLRVGREPESLPALPLREPLRSTLAWPPLALEPAFTRLAAQHQSALQVMTRLDFESYLPDDILVKVDRASMLAALEVRAPLLDQRIVELAFSLRDEQRLRGLERKWLLKRLAARYLPADFPLNRKQGFSIPEALWLQESWGDMLIECAQRSALLDPLAVRGLVQQHRRHGRYGTFLFRLLMLALFERHWLTSVELGART